jgi:hypothetical protein
MTTFIKLVDIKSVGCCKVVVARCCVNTVFIAINVSMPISMNQAFDKNTAL